MKRITLYGLLIGGIFIAFSLLENAFYSRWMSLDIYLLLLGGICLALGIFAGVKASRSAAQPGVAPAKGPSLQTDSPLSKREQEILLLIGKGHSNQQIADELFISLNTTKTHLKNIYQKLNVKRRTEALFRAREMGIME